MSIILMQNGAVRTILSQSHGPTKVFVYNQGPDVISVGPPGSAATVTQVDIQPLSGCLFISADALLQVSVSGVAMIEVTYP